MRNLTVEILATNPRDDDIAIMPIFEQVIGQQPSGSAEPKLSLAQALGTFAAGENLPLITILEADERACEFILRLEDTWYVRAEGASNTPNDHVREISQARHFARSIQTRRMALLAADECLTG